MLLKSIYETYSKSIVTEAEFTQNEMNKAGNLNFFQSFTVTRVIHSSEFYTDQSTFKFRLLNKCKAEPTYFLRSQLLVLRLVFSLLNKEKSHGVPIYLFQSVYLSSHPCPVGRVVLYIDCFSAEG